LISGQQGNFAGAQLKLALHIVGHFADGGQVALFYYLLDRADGVEIGDDADGGHGHQGQGKEEQQELAADIQLQ